MVGNNQTSKDNLAISESTRQSRCDLVIFMSLMMSASFVNGYAVPSANQLADLLNTKYEWTTASEKSLHQSFIGSSVVAGMAVGALIGGKMI